MNTKKYLESMLREIQSNTIVDMKEVMMHKLYQHTFMDSENIIVDEKSYELILQGMEEMIKLCDTCADLVNDGFQIDNMLEFAGRDNHYEEWKQKFNK